MSLAVWARSVLWLLSLCMLGLAALGVMGWRINTSASVPMGFYRLSNKPITAVRVGDVVWWCPPDSPIFRLALERGYFGAGSCPTGAEHLFKRVVAMPGDQVTIDDTGVTVNGVWLANSRPLSHDASQRALPKIRWHLRIVPAGDALLLGDNSALSFDGRYVGWVSLKHVEGVAELVDLVDVF